VISPFHEMRIADEHGQTVPPGEIGEIVVRSPMSTSSYWNMPEQTSKAFFPGQWFRPKDIGYIDRDGFLFYLDRATDRIATSSRVVYPHVVEAAVQAHSSVANCGVVGLGAADVQEVVAAVLLKPGTEASDALSGEILTIAMGQLKSHEVPARVVFVQQPPTVLGGAKVQREVLQAQLSKTNT
jgi:acyl-coenzyme A synthetase/AMP-(fatty) acid ligase